MVSQRTGFGKKILEGWPLNFLEVGLAAKPGIEIIFEKRAEINLFEGIFLVLGSGRSLFGTRLAFTLFFAAANIVNQRNRIFQFFKNGVLHHLGGDHVFELKFIERKDANHLHQARGKDLALRDFEVKPWLKKNHKCRLGSFVVRRAPNLAMTSGVHRHGKSVRRATLDGFIPN